MACKVVRICGKRRKICRDRKGRITSNKPAGGGGRRRKSTKKRRSTKRRSTKRTRRSAKGRWVTVSKKAGTKGKGRLKKGCKWGRGRYKGKVRCKRAA